MAPCLRMTVKHPTRRLLYTMHRAPCRPTVLTTDLNPTYSCSSSIQSRSMSNYGSPLVDAEKGILVYHGPEILRVKGIKAYSVGATGLGLLTVPHSLTLRLPEVDPLVVGGLAGVALLIPAMLLHALGKRYVLDLYYNKDSNSFTATTLTFFCRRKITVFTPKDVTFPDTTLSPMCFMKVRGTPMFVEPSMFTSRKAYNKLMGL